jgi:acyl-CoA dehydrogenase
MNLSSERTDKVFQSLLDAAKRIATEVAAPNAADVDAKARFPKESVAAMREAKLFSAAIPRDFGGTGCGMFELGQWCSRCTTASSDASRVTPWAARSSRPISATW